MIDYSAFTDELEKIGGVGTFLQKQIKNVGNTINDFANPIKSMKAGWESGAAGRSFGGWGGKLLTDKNKPSFWRHLPVGPKAQITGFTALEAPGALAKEDPSGEGRSRLRRVSGTLGGTGGFLVGGRHGLLGSLVGGAIGQKMLSGSVGLGESTVEAVKQLKRQRKFNALNTTQTPVGP